MIEISLKNISKTVNSEFKGNGEQVIRGAAPFDNASSDEITLAENAKFIKKINETGAGAIIVPKRFFESETITTSKNLIFSEHPRVAFAKICSLFAPVSNMNLVFKPDHISSDARIGNNFSGGDNMVIAPFVVIGENVTIGDRTRLYPNVVIGSDVVIGNDVLIYPNVTIYDRCTIGSHVIIHSGSVIGSDGFGFAHDGQKYYKIPQTGMVQIDDDVEIGACNTIDRATFGKTWIKQGVKTDNLVQIGHNVTVGENSAIVAQVGISGSTSIGKNAVLAGQAGISGHITIGDNVTIGPKAGIAKSVSSNQVVSGAPEMPHMLWLRVQKIIPQLPDLKKRLTKFEKQLNDICKK
jgi:UDP-3-O-[3-hydroxymyristoyl] glucosamine N-acyltransferase